MMPPAPTIILTQRQIPLQILANRLLFWNKIQFDHAWLEEYIFRKA
jgi:hypothetical protein